METLHYYDMPLIGIYRTHGQSWLFWCAEGQATDWSVWGYLPLEEDELQDLQTSDDVFGAVRALRARHPDVIIGVSHDGEGLLRVIEVHDSAADPLDTALGAFPDIAAELKVLRD